MATLAPTLRTDGALEAASNALVNAEGNSPQDVMNRTVLEPFRPMNHQVKIQDPTSKMIERWGDALRRLGSD